MDLLFVLIVLAVAIAAWFVTKKVTEGKLKPIITGLDIELSDERFITKGLKDRKEVLEDEILVVKGDLSSSRADVGKWRHLYEQEKNNLRDLRLSIEDVKSLEKVKEDVEKKTPQKKVPQKRTIKKKRSPRSISNKK